MDKIEEIIKLIDQYEIALVFEKIEELGIMNPTLALLKKEYISGVSRTDVNYLDRLKTTVRSLDRSTISSRSINTKRKILFLAASPANETRLQVGLEHRLIKAELNQGKHRDQFDFLDPQFSVTVQELIRAVKDRPQIIHFSGHSNTEGICIDSGNGMSELLPLKSLQRLFKPIKESLELVLLNSCYSAFQAKAISESANCYVIGHKPTVMDEDAIRLAQGLYTSLGTGTGIEEAYNDALIVAHDIDGEVSIWKDGIELNL